MEDPKTVDMTDEELNEPIFGVIMLQQYSLKKGSIKKGLKLFGNVNEVAIMKDLTQIRGGVLVKMCIFSLTFEWVLSVNSWSHMSN